MTTNRPGDIDEAFVSRIHVSLELNSPQKDERAKLWRIFLKDLDMPEDDRRALIDFATKRFEEDNLNGRQIRNTVRVALAMAKLQKSNVEPGHLEEVVKIGRKYARYNENLSRMDPEAAAIQLGRRAQTDETLEDED